MKKIISLMMVIVMLLMLPACKGCGGSDSSSGNNNENNAATQAAKPDEAETENSANQGGEVEGAMTPGKLYFINLKDGEEPLIRGVRITGNRAGSTEFNAKDTKTENIRCIFELNEWIDFYPDTDLKYDMKVWILEHREDQSSYETTQYSDLMPGFVNYCGLYDYTDEDPESSWGSFYLNKDECKPGYYDFVFTYEGKPVAKLLTRFYEEEELGAKTDAELEKLMSGMNVK